MHIYIHSRITYTCIQRMFMNTIRPMPVCSQHENGRRSTQQKTVVMLLFALALLKRLLWKCACVQANRAFWYVTDGAIESPANIKRGAIKQLSSCALAGAQRSGVSGVSVWKRMRERERVCVRFGVSSACSMFVNASNWRNGTAHSSRGRSLE